VNTELEAELDIVLCLCVGVFSIEKRLLTLKDCVTGQDFLKVVNHFIPLWEEFTCCSFQKTLQVVEVPVLARCSLPADG